jgi:hypothetical protein
MMYVISIIYFHKFIYVSNVFQPHFESKYLVRNDMDDCKCEYPVISHEKEIKLHIVDEIHLRKTKACIF